jgi:hypothetical protein
MIQSQILKYNLFFLTQRVLVTNAFLLLLCIFSSVMSTLQNTQILLLLIFCLFRRTVLSGTRKDSTITLSCIKQIIFCYKLTLIKSQNSAIGIATGYGLDDRGVGVQVPVGLRIFTSPSRPDRLSVSPFLLSSRYRGLFPRG